jgi:hypothetical protein
MCIISVRDAACMSIVRDSAKSPLALLETALKWHERIYCPVRILSFAGTCDQVCQILKGLSHEIFTVFLA